MKKSVEIDINNSPYLDSAIKRLSENAAQNIRNKAIAKAKADKESA